MATTLTISLILFLLGSLIFSVFKTEEEIEIEIEEDLNDSTEEDIEIEDID